MKQNWNVSFMCFGEWQEYEIIGTYEEAQRIADELRKSHAHVSVYDASMITRYGVTTL